ncbi:sensor histidine kinase [Sphingomonas lenta]|uniref:histidine kinase n=1 Tax=Sphingomonas lenta TaxID=1141887 RepID=A0A2A2SGU2_9SPHN|nr:HAMP domain-containing sensor histidine kinase [Sphingomonas lenta]PAX08459.1 hypothetical protein CKY28_03455 [Sphingomonas lenta]
MRFDDSLRTVLNSDVTTGFGARSAWRQLVDLAGRGRAPTDEPVIARLRMLREVVPAEVRAASARGLAYARPDARLVGFFAEDTLAIAAPVLRTAELPAVDWIALLPRLSPALRSVLRHRRDLPGDVVRALESFGSIDFALPEPDALELQPDMIAAPEPATSAEPLFTPPPNVPLSESPFVALGEVARGLPVVAEALARTEPETAPPPPPTDGFAISDLVARIEAFRRRREEEPAESAEPIDDKPERFQFETDATGAIIGVQGVARGPLVGLSIAHAGVQGMAQIDGVATGAFRRRSRFEDARLEVGGASTATGSWRLSAVPTFDPATGRFTGFRGTGRRPRADESAAPIRRAPSPDSLRQLVHELRTPTNAIAGFAELIESELLGPVPETYRAQAGAIRTRAADLLAAIEDLDTASRIEMGALELRPGPILLQPLIERVVGDLAPLAGMRGVRVLVDADDGARALADDRAAERLLGRLLATLVSAGVAGETIRASVYANPSSVEIAVDRPRALVDLDAEALLALDGGDEEGAPLLGTGFALRVSRNLAGELGGGLEFGPKRLTLRLPAAVDRSMEHATTS